MNKIQTYGFVLCLCAMTAFDGSAQEQNTQIQQLLAQRQKLAADHQSYSGIEKEIATLGQYPPALVTKTSPEGKTKFDFTTYKDIRTEREAAIAERIKVSIPEVESVAISNRQISIVFRPAATETNISEFFKLMGYNSYEIKAD